MEFGDRPKTVAIDFDGVIAKYKTFVADDHAGEPVDLEMMVDEISKLREMGWKIIIWSSRKDQSFVESYLQGYHIPYDAINHNPWAPANVIKSRKIQADVYCDDKAIRFDGTWNGFSGNVLFFEPWWSTEETATGLTSQELDERHAHEKELKDNKGHTYHCANRIVWGDGECECGQAVRLKIAEEQIAEEQCSIHGDEENWDNAPEEVKAVRPHLPLSVCGYNVDQVALFTSNIFTSIREYEKQGYKNWIIDEVRAMQQTGLYVSESNMFRVKLAFNYDILPGGVEFELLQLLEGESVQLHPKWREFQTGLSHYGFHVDDMDIAIATFAQAGYRLMSNIKTQWHSNAPNKYLYAYMDTRKLGFVSKLIIKQEGES